MSDEDLLNTTIQSIYQAFLTKTPFDKMLENIARFTNSERSAIHIIDPQFQGGASFQYYNCDPEVWELYNSHYGTQDPRLQAALSVEIGEVLLAQEAVSNKDIENTEYYQTLHEKFDMQDIMYGVFDKSASTGQSAITTYKRDLNGYFDKTNSARLEILLPHIENAQKTASSLLSSSLSRNLTPHLNDKLMLTIRSDMKFEPVGTDWQTTWNRIGVFSTSYGQLTASPLSLQAKIKQYLTIAITKKQGSVLPFLGKSGRKYIARISPMFEEIKHLIQHKPDDVAIIEISTPNEDCSVGLEVFRASFDLSAKEIDVLHSFCQTFNLRQSASDLGITYETIRWHMKHILEKCQVSGQPELLYKLASVERM